MGFSGFKKTLLLVIKLLSHAHNITDTCMLHNKVNKLHNMPPAYVTNTCSTRVISAVASATTIAAAKKKQQKKYNNRYSKYAPSVQIYHSVRMYVHVAIHYSYNHSNMYEHVLYACNRSFTVMTSCGVEVF